MFAPAPRHGGSIQLIYFLAVLCLGIAFFLLTHHAPRRWVEAELAIPTALLLYGGGAMGGLGQRGRAKRLAPLIAIVGCDGSGKSTLSSDLRARVSIQRPVALAYLGLGSGDLGNRIKALPLIGPSVERVLSRKASQTRDKGRKIPGLLTALVVFAFSLVRVWRFRRVLALRRSGIAVITDRYPQTDVAGFYDGPGLSAARAGSPVVAWLAAAERRLYGWMASFRPDIVLRLNIDEDTAYHRKPDHARELLRAKVEATQLLRFAGARIVDLDARSSYAEVRRQAQYWIAPVLARADRCDAVAG